MKIIKICAGQQQPFSSDDISKARTNARTGLKNLNEIIRSNCLELGLAAESLKRYLSIPVNILIIGLLKEADNDPEGLTQAIGKLLQSMDNKTAIVVEPEPVLMIIGEELTYRDILTIEDLSLEQPKRFAHHVQYFDREQIKGKLVAEVYPQVQKFLKRLKSTCKYKERKEIKRQGMAAKYRCTSLEEWPLASSPITPEHVVIRHFNIFELLKLLRDEARSLGWRADRIINMLKVAEFCIDQMGLRGASRNLELSRDTVIARKKDLIKILGRLIRKAA